MIINGKEISQKIKDQLKIQINELKQQKKRVPLLAVVLVGHNQASEVYIRNKVKACEYIGIASQVIRKENDCTQDELLSIIEKLNKDVHVDGILVQLPLPAHIDEEIIIRSINPDKDVDGFHPINVAKLFLNEEGFIPCTPHGMMVMLDEIGYNPGGKEVVVVGRSNIVGKPVSLLMLHKNATVTIAHSYTTHLKEITQRADVLITAVGKANFFDQSYIKEGAVVLDVGINRDENGKLCGDCNYQDMAEKAYAITPVPGGVGPMTIAMLMTNTLLAYHRRSYGI